ncbi:Uncharacterized protein dnm_098360 [Desulfonema magnum]|uniref:Uncharacterized protein n=1 Tax=Desulfonema magnum TaxID=45655 RepID=A0A975GU70_9BACT|nr:Uncharacterized protein dnm_098360 [Desulfonema magnum]
MVSILVLMEVVLKERTFMTLQNMIFVSILVLMEVVLKDSG